jgi:hypothetical protein
MFEVRKFHGLASFYRNFIRDFSGICAPMMDTMKNKHNYFKWTKEVKRIFNILKDKIKERPIMVLPNFEKTFQVRCDVSGVAIGAVLSQDNRLVAYMNEKMNETKIKYSTYDNEFYAIIQSLKK